MCSPPFAYHFIGQRGERAYGMERVSFQCHHVRYPFTILVSQRDEKTELDGLLVPISSPRKQSTRYESRILRLPMMEQQPDISAPCSTVKQT